MRYTGRTGQTACIASLLALLLFGATGRALAAPTSPPPTAPAAPAPAQPREQTPAPARTLPPAAHTPSLAPALAAPDLSKLPPVLLSKLDGVLLSVHAPASSSIEQVWLIGIEPFRPRDAAADAAADAASTFLANLLTGEHLVMLDHEAGRRLDASKRRGVYLYRLPDGLLINAELVRQGYCREQSDVPYQFSEAMRAFEGLARAAKKGLWAEIKPPVAIPDPKATKPADSAALPPREGPQGVPLAAAPESEATKPTPANSTTTTPTKGATVYITKSGTKYHAIGCRHLSKSQTSITVETAKKQGLEPCGDCKPDKSK